MDRTAEARFPSPFDVGTPAGAEGWQRMYPYYLLFSEENREYEDNTLWFQDGMHHPEVLYPFDTITHESWRIALGQYNTRVFDVPPAYGIEQRILNGFLYIAAVPVADPSTIPARVGVFMERAGHYYGNWNAIFEDWKAKMTKVIEDLKAVEVPHLTKLDPDSVVFEHRGQTSGMDLLLAYNRVIDSVFIAWQYHFEMLNLGYAAYLNLFTFAKQAFPGVKEETLAQMVAGADILFFRPDDELKRLAKLGLDLGISDKLRAGGKADDIIAGLRGDPAGEKWIAALDEAKEPWFNYSNGAGFYHHLRSWIDDMTVPWSAMLGYMDRLERGESLDRPKQEILDRRERLTAEYRDLLSTDEDKATFDQNVGLARTVATYIEDHNFYVEHWYHTLFWNKMREFGSRLVEGGVLEQVDDVFYLNRWDVGQALYDMVAGWASGAPTRSPAYWQAEIAERKRLCSVLAEAGVPSPALGPVPDEITEPFTVLLWGITTDRVKAWLGEGAQLAENELRGVPGSPGIAEGPARVVLTAAELDTVQEGDILVCPITAPSWGPVFGSIRAAVCDIGGIMSHAAIVAREYGLPAVVGTGTATKRIKSGDRLRVDANTGVVTILS
ncbi:MAG TPA: PEP-utilizing enzyme [Candidatus Limnocylindrales bacterium]|nr:PEP-utilizing enzyme [Candidatus Limnocylindrales bacterium]